MSQTPTPAWSENDSQKFIDLGRYFVPNRELQIATICDLIPEHDGPFNVLELSCGEGLLAESILQRFPTSIVYGYDLSPAMLQRAQQRLAAYGNRFQTQQFALADDSWRSPAWPVHAVISSLTIHHLDDAGKEALYHDVFRMLAPGGVFVVADLVQPASSLGKRVAERTWDRAVEERALKLDGNTDAAVLFEQEKWNLYRYPDPVDTPSRLFDQLQWLEKAGFREVDVCWMRAGHAIFGGTKQA